jgi:hypothetical protein
MHAAHRTTPSCKGVIDLRYGLAPTGSCEFIGTKKACQKSTAIA